MKKKIFSILLSLCMVITMVPFMAFNSFATDPIDYFYIKNEENGFLSIQFLKHGAQNLPDDVHLQWTTNPSGSWTDLTITKNSGNTNVTSVNNKGDKVYFRCGNDSGVYSNHQLSKQMDGSIMFKIMGKFSAGGDIRSLVTNPNSPTLDGTTSLGDYAFYGLFFTSHNIVSFDSDLSTSTVGNYAYSHMFIDCENLKKAPNINANTLGEGACERMFYECTSLENAPNLPTTNLDEFCYEDMFNECTSLKTPPALPAPEVPYCAYHCMFKKCTDLEYIPELPALQTGEGAYDGMFSFCTQFKICAEKTPNKCYKVFRMPGSGTMTQVGSGFSSNMFGDTSGVASPSANTTYYYKTDLDHTYSCNLYDSDKHQKVCSACGETVLENHSYMEPMITNGLKLTACSVCGYVKVESVPGPTEIDELKEEVKKLEEEIKNITTPPAKTTSALTPGKKKIQVSWKKVNGATHYQIYYKRSGASENTITVAAKNSKTTITNLKSGKKYTVKVRGIKKMDRTITYGTWSASKTAKVK